MPRSQRSSAGRQNGRGSSPDWTHGSNRSGDDALGVVLVFGEDPQAIVDADGAERPHQNVGPAPVHLGPHDTVQRDVSVLNLDRNNRAALAAAGPECRILFQPVRNQLLEVIVFQQFGHRSARLSSHTLLTTFKPSRSCPADGAATLRRTVTVLRRRCSLHGSCHLLFRLSPAASPNRML